VAAAVDVDVEAWWEDDWAWMLRSGPMDEGGRDRLWWSEILLAGTERAVYPAAPIIAKR
jgi:hypothetical protein